MGKPDTVPYTPFTPGQCTGGGGIISQHVYDDFIYELSLDNITLKPGLTFVNIIVEWYVDQDTSPYDKTEKFYTHQYSDEDFSYIIDKSSRHISVGTGAQPNVNDDPECIYISNAYIDTKGTTAVIYTPEIYSYSMNNVTEMQSSDRNYSLNTANNEWVLFNNGQNDSSGPDVNKFKIIDAKSVKEKTS